MLWVSWEDVSNRWEYSVCLTISATCCGYLERILATCENIQCVWQYLQHAVGILRGFWQQVRIFSAFDNIHNMLWVSWEDVSNRWEYSVCLTKSATCCGYLERMWATGGNIQCVWQYPQHAVGILRGFEQQVREYSVHLTISATCCGYLERMGASGGTFSAFDNICNMLWVSWEDSSNRWENIHCVWQYPLHAVGILRGCEQQVGIFSVFDDIRNMLWVSWEDSSNKWEYSVCLTISGTCCVYLERMWAIDENIQCVWQYPQHAVGILRGFTSQHSDTAPCAVSWWSSFWPVGLRTDTSSGCGLASVPCKYVSKCQSETQYPGMLRLEWPLKQQFQIWLPYVKILIVIPSTIPKSLSFFFFFHPAYVYSMYGRLLSLLSHFFYLSHPLLWQYQFFICPVLHNNLH